MCMLPHGSYLETLRRRKVSAQPDQIRAMDFTGFSGADIEGGFFALENGHAVLWWDWSGQGADNKPNAERYPQYLEQWGQVKADWMLGRARNLIIYPNLLLTDHASTQIRVIKPLAWDQTEVSIYCFGLKGESLTERGRRLRQYEDFSTPVEWLPLMTSRFLNFAMKVMQVPITSHGMTLVVELRTSRKEPIKGRGNWGLPPSGLEAMLRMSRSCGLTRSFGRVSSWPQLLGGWDGVPRSTLDLESGTTTVSGVERERAREGATSPSS
jgi:hypothetical protein